MAGKTTIDPIITTKLHRPQIHGVYLYRQQLIDHLDKRRNRPLSLISAPAGYGKSTLASYWLDTSDSPSAWVSLDANDNDLRLFLSYFLTAIQTIFPDFGRQTLAMVNAETLPPVSELAGTLINDIDRIEQSFILALDDIHLIEDESVLELLNQLLRHPPQSMHLMLIGRWEPALPIAKLRANRLMTEIRTQALRFSAMEIEKLLTQMLGTQVDPSTAAALAEKTEGWVTGLVLAAISLRNRGSLDPALLEPQVNAQSVMEYLFSEVFSQQPSEITQYLMNTAILDRFCGPLCETVCANGDDPSTSEIGGWEFIKWLNKQNLFLIPLDHEKRWFRYHHLFQKLLLNQLKSRLSQDEIKALHVQASKWYAENGLIEEAVKHALTGENPQAAVQMIANHGFNLLDDAQWPRLQRWLNMIPPEIGDQEVDLLLLSAYLHQIYSRYPELGSCLDKVEALCTNRTAEASVEGHLNTLRAFQHFYDANGERSVTCAKRAIKKLPLNQRWARQFVFLVKALAHQMIGDRNTALATFDEAMRESDLYGEIKQSHFLSNPCHFHWMEADLLSMLQTAEQALGIGADNQPHQTMFQGLYFKGVVHYCRNELQAAEEILAPVVKEPYSQYAWNFIHSAFALAMVYQARGRTDEANKVGEAIVSYALNSNHPLMLEFSRAFLAELALRQGQLAEASHWAGQFTAKPFAAMYRFYVPHLTLVRVLMKQDNTDSRKQAAGLLEQLYDFVTHTHNRRVQIDVLALQSLLYDSDGEESAALESLTHALQLAKPGGFIRPFVDLGLKMEGLLKQLMKNKVAVEYIGRILAAFRDDTQRAAQDMTSTQPLPKLQVESETEVQIQNSLLDPLTNRELDVLELLTQRLSNKEISEKLFISDGTVKNHLKNIYQKLNVKKRREAVEKAKALKILD
jgi:LuxR family maltose regulon positive regulatory protein